MGTGSGAGAGGSRGRDRGGLSAGRLAALAATPILLVAISLPLLANGGTVRISRAPVGPYLVSVLSSPTPLRTGEVDISVMVQDSAEQVLSDVSVTVEAHPAGFVADPIRQPATREQATNRLFRAAKFDVSTPGEWEFRVHVGGAADETVSFRAEVARSTILDRPFLLALLILLPLGVVGWLLTRRADEAGSRRVSP